MVTHPPPTHYGLASTHVCILRNSLLWALNWSMGGSQGDSKTEIEMGSDSMHRDKTKQETESRTPINKKDEKNLQEDYINMEPKEIHSDTKVSYEDINK